MYKNSDDHPEKEKMSSRSLMVLLGVVSLAIFIIIAIETGVSLYVEGIKGQDEPRQEVVKVNGETYESIE